MKKRKGAKLPRKMLGQGGIELTINIREGISAGYSHRRLYQKSGLDVEVTRRSADRRREQLLCEYIYDGKPLIESWPQERGKRFNNRTSEMVIASRALAGLGLREVSLSPKMPPHPDLFVKSATTGSLAVEITKNIDTGDAAFQSGMRRFLTAVNRVAAGKASLFPCDVNLGFVALPQRADQERVAKAVVAEVLAHADARGARQFSGELAGIFSQYLIGHRGAAQPFSGGAVVNTLGLPDLTAITLRQIAYKRDLADYRVSGRATWLIVGMSGPRLGLQVMSDLYSTDIDLGQFDCIVLSDVNELVTYRRIELHLNER